MKSCKLRERSKKKKKARQIFRNAYKIKRDCDNFPVDEASYARPVGEITIFMMSFRSLIGALCEFPSLVSTIVDPFWLFINNVS